MSVVAIAYDCRWARDARCVTGAYAIAFSLAAALATLLHQRGVHPVLVAGLADAFATVLVFAFSLEHGNTSVYDPYWHLAPPVIASYWIFARGECVNIYKNVRPRKGLPVSQWCSNNILLA
ncbi:hypothetical protein T492DRAFT_488912 [Pavlovales sp. CCMP2436]|nr:hypothetical protein T492DRAFT_488912 [Pavlovales sp. CCMP2436]